jgi:hypothetical protein
MMTQFDEYANRAPEQWHSLAARKRLDLSASVEEAMRDTSLQEEQESDEMDNPSQHLSRSTGLVPPRLSLQSKQVPAIRPLMPAEVPWSSPVDLDEKYEQNQVQTSLPPSVRSNEATCTPQNYHMTRRTTKVRLQVVPPPREAAGIEEASPVPVDEAITNPDLPLVEKTERPKPVLPTLPGVSAERASLTGVGAFERGQCDLAVENTHVTAASVVLAVLTGDPGPVVVQYVSLQPGIGFTVHLSAPAQNPTPFNYVIL